MDRGDIEAGLVVIAICAGVVLAIVGIVAVITWTIKTVWSS